MGMFDGLGGSTGERKELKYRLNPGGEADAECVEEWICPCADHDPADFEGKSMGPCCVHSDDLDDLEPGDPMPYQTWLFSGAMMLLTVVGTIFILENAMEAAEALADFPKGGAAGSTRSCTNPLPDPVTNSTDHFGDCCDEYGITAKPLWVLFAQSVFTALVVDMIPYLLRGTTNYFTWGSMATLPACFLILQSLLSTVITYAIMAKYNYSGNSGWDNYSGLVYLWCNSSPGFMFALQAYLTQRESTIPKDSWVTVTPTRQANGIRASLCVVFCVFILNLFAFPFMLTHLIPGMLIWFPILVVAVVPAQHGLPPVAAHLLPSKEYDPDSLCYRVIFGLIAGLMNAWTLTAWVYVIRFLPSFFHIFAVRGDWVGAIVQDWESRSTNRFLECAEAQLNADHGAIGVADVLALFL